MGCRDDARVSVQVVCQGPKYHVKHISISVKFTATTVYKTGKWGGGEGGGGGGGWGHSAQLVGGMNSGPTGELNKVQASATIYCAAPRFVLWK